MNRPNDPLEDSLQLLEEELNHLRPLPPTEGLQARIFSALAAGEPEAEPARPFSEEASRRRRLWFGAIPLAAAAAIALAAVALVGPPRPQTANSGLAEGASIPAPEAGPALDLRPVSAESKLVGEQNEGVMRDAQGAFSIQRRRHYLETREVRDARTGTIIRINVPREDVVREPLDIQ